MRYIYKCTPSGWDSARRFCPLPSKEDEMAIDQFIDNEVKGNDVVLFMKGTPQFPMCGFSGQVVQILDHLGVTYKGLNVLEYDDLRNGIKSLLQLADHPAALRQGRVRRRLRHRARDVPGGRAADAAQGQGRRHEGARPPETFALFYSRVPSPRGASSALRDLSGRLKRTTEGISARR